MRNPDFARRAAGTQWRLLAGAITALWMLSSVVLGQGSAVGNLNGTVTSPKGASISGAAVTLTKKLTGEVFRTTTSPAGTYAFRDVPAGDYVVHVEAQGFSPGELLVRVQEGSTAAGDVRLQRLPPPPSELIKTQSPAVESIQPSADLEQLPSSRNFLDLVDLLPGIQVLDGVTLAASKSGLTSASIAGRSGRTTRMLADGVDVSDEIGGGTTQNLPVSSIQELQIGQSLLALSSGLAAAGVVNVVTRSGANDLHGQLSGNFRDKSAGVANFVAGQDNPYSREVFGGGLGGALKPGKLFFYVSGEYFKQDLSAPVIFNAPFTALDGSYRSPFRGTELEGRLDYKLSAQTRVFYRFTYDNDRAVNSSGGYNFQPFRNHDDAPGHAGGLDFNTGAYTHGLRFAYNRYANHIADAVNGTNIFNPAPGISLNFGGGSGFGSGPNPAAPQRTVQANKEVRYDGSRTLQAHTFHFGFALNKIDALVLAGLASAAPEVGVDTGARSMTIAATGGCIDTVLCGVNNPLNYPVDSIILGNGRGCFSEKSAFGSPCGGVGDTRLQASFGDSWKVRSNLTLTYGLQYVRDTGRTDSDLPAIPCSAVASSFGSQVPCTGSSPLLNSFGQVPGLGNRVRQPNLNFAPQLGAAWDPGKSGRTVFRVGIGLYYDNSELHNVLYDRAARLASGQFSAQSNDPCASNGVVGGVLEPVVVLPGNSLQSAAGLCGQPVGTVASTIAGLQKAYQMAFIATSPNPNFVGQILSAQQGLLAPNFQTPRSVQMNIGFDHQMGQGTVLAVNYLRNVGTHYPLGLDTNHVGDATRFNTDCQPVSGPVPTNCQAALHAISATVTPFGCPAAMTVGAGSGSSQQAVACYLALNIVPAPTIADFASHGLDSGAQFLGGLPASVYGLTPDTGAAFAGQNPLVGRSTVFFPAGRSLYSGLEISLRSQLHNPVRGVADMNLQLAFTHSSFRSNSPEGLGDQDLLPLAADFNQPTAFFGSAPGDRKNQFSLAAVMELPMKARASFAAHFASPLPQTLFLPAENIPGEIFRTDVTGDGSFGGQSQTGNNSFGDILPGTNIGSFGRAVSASGLNTIIQNYNSQQAGSLTPAGQALVTAGLLTQLQMVALHATEPTVLSAPPGNVGLGWLRTFDFTLAWPLKIRDRFTVEPRVSAFNLLNFANFDGPGYQLGGILNGSAGEANGTTTANRSASRIGFGSGVFTQGAPRQLEFGLRIAF